MRRGILGALGILVCVLSSSSAAEILGGTEDPISVWGIPMARHAAIAVLVAMSIAALVCIPWVRNRLPPRPGDIGTAGAARSLLTHSRIVSAGLLWVFLPLSALPAVGMGVHALTQHRLSAQAPLLAEAVRSLVDARVSLAEAGRDPKAARWTAPEAWADPPLEAVPGWEALRGCGSETVRLVSSQSIGVPVSIAEARREGAFSVTLTRPGCAAEVQASFLYTATSGFAPWSTVSVSVAGR